MDAGLLDRLLMVLKDYPGYLCLLAVIYLLFKAIMAKDETLKEFLKISSGEVERTTRITTLLEILVSDKRGGGQ